MVDEDTGLSSRTYLSIGDVLTLLRQEFPDVTISKIRFLESQGLVDPERTPSGYRKFYEHDVDRLRWVLRQQRENFLPLKVIKGRLDSDDDGFEYEDGGDAGEMAGAGTALPAAASTEAFAPHAHSHSGSIAAPATGNGMPRSTATRSGGDHARQTLPGFEPTRPPSSPGGPARLGAAGSARSAGSASSASPASPAAPQQRGREVEVQGRQTPKRAAGRKAPASPPAASLVEEGEQTFEELKAASGCSPATLTGLASYGLITSRSIAGTQYYDQDSLAVAKLAASFEGFGVEPRHLRLHKHAAEREAGFIELVVLPLFKQRNPESRQRAYDTVGELSRLGQELRAVMLRRALRDQLGE